MTTLKKDALFPLYAVVLTGLSACGPQSAGEQPIGLDVGTMLQPIVIGNGRELNGRELNGRELNGRELNGRELNGRELNGRELNGRELNGVALSGAKLDGVKLSGLKLKGTLLVGSTENGGSVSGSELVGTVLKPESGGKALAYRIDDYFLSSDTDMHLYQVSVGADATWFPYCGSDEDGEPILATAVAGRWDYGVNVSGGGSKINDPSSFTFACLTGAIAKCVMLGYKPWKKLNGDSLAAHHQTCTRVLRADYCGNGQSFTKNGVLINIYDGIGVQPDTDKWGIEAEWAEDGALCLENRRVPSNEPVSCVSQTYKHCGSTAHFSSGALIMNEVPLTKSIK